MKNFIRKHTTIIYTLFISILLCSCEKEIDIDLKSVPPKILIEGEVREGELVKIRISHTIDFNNNNGYPLVNDAVVKVSDDQGNTETLLQDNSGYYVAKNLKGEIGRTYNLFVEYNNMIYTASSKMSPMVEIGAIKMFITDFKPDNLFPQIYFLDPPGTDNTFYRCLLYVNGKQRKEMHETVISAEYMDGNIVSQIIFFDDQTEKAIQKGDTVMMELQSIYKHVYTFFKTLNNVENGLTNPTSNIKGGALGYFSAYSFNRMTVIAVEE